MSQPAAPAVESATAAIRGMSSPIETFGSRIRRLRKARGMTREAFANACGTTVECIAQWEIRTAPRVAVLPRVASALDVSLDYLLTGVAFREPTSKKRGDSPWPESDGKLTQFWTEGHSTAEIGLRLGVLKSAVIRRASRIGLPARPSPIKRRPIHE